ncbi:hypothetical protein K439DRAFT_1619794 [Ramaria rubella]|nr:hypothetical protein K439DRAFT_1619794 [Ramaria rubella]
MAQQWFTLNFFMQDIDIESPSTPVIALPNTTACSTQLQPWKPLLLHPSYIPTDEHVEQQLGGLQGVTKAPHEPALHAPGTKGMSGTCQSQNALKCSKCHAKQRAAIPMGRLLHDHQVSKAQAYMALESKDTLTHSKPAFLGRAPHLDPPDIACASKPNQLYIPHRPGYY